MSILVGILLFGTTALANICPYSRFLGPEDERLVADLIARTGSDDFETREEASDKLLELRSTNVAVEARLRDTLVTTESAEVRFRMNRILNVRLTVTWPEVAECLLDSILGSALYGEHETMMRSLFLKKDLVAIRAATRGIKGMKDVINFADFPLEWIEVDRLVERTRPMIEASLKNAGKLLVDYPMHDTILFKHNDNACAIRMNNVGRHSIIHVDDKGLEKSLTLSVKDIFPATAVIRDRGGNIFLKPETFQVKLRGLIVATAGLVSEDPIAETGDRLFSGGYTVKRLVRRLTWELGETAKKDPALEAW